MDRRDSMALHGSGSYYIQRDLSGSGNSYYTQRGISGTDHGTQSMFHGSQGVVHPLPNQSVPFGSNPGASTGFGSTPLPAEHSPASLAISPHGGGGGGGSAVASAPSSEQPVKRKRGRPRKYGQDGSVSLALSPAVSSSATPNPKRGRGRPPGSGKKHRLGSMGALLPAISGIGFIPHVIAISVGEDIVSKITSFSEQGPRALCILSANGSVSSATLRQPSSSPRAVTYEGRFEIISLFASCAIATDGSFSNRIGDLTVSLASPDGRMIGGGVGGPLLAASPTQVIVGSFIWSDSKTKNKKQADDATDDQSVDNAAAASRSQVPPHETMVPSQSMWGASRPIDMRSSHVDIDLMRG